MRQAGPHKVAGYVASEAAMSGPLVPPGTYQVRLTVGEMTLTQTFEIVPDPRISASQHDLEAQYALAVQVRDALSQTNDAIRTIRSLRAQVEEWERRTKKQKDAEAIAEAGRALKEKLTALEEELIQTKAKSRQDTLNYPIKLNTKIAFLGFAVGSAEAAPTRQAQQLYEELAGKLAEYLKQLQALIETEVAAFNARVRELGVSAVLPPVITNGEE
jgi:exonuclease VII large subunit